MRSTVSKTIVTLGMVLTMGLTTQQNANATVMTGGAAAIPQAMMALSFGGYFAFAILDSTTDGIPVRVEKWMLPALIQTFVWGLILDKTSNQISFTELSEKNAQSLKLSEKERAAFNDEIDRINGATAELYLDTNKGLSNEEIANNFKQEISSDAFTAVQKVIAGSIAK